ncbi:zeta toxin family protein [Wenyingzhuangia sp. IMCC45574]
MNRPKLTIIAGCNGSGKSSFSKSFTKNDVTPYDYDKVYKQKYQSLIETEFRDQMAHNLARKDLESTIQNHLENKLDFCYETNFNSTPLFWPEKFKANNYQIEIVFFCLDSLEKAKERVRIRFENGGHFVPDKEVEKRYFLGFENLNMNWDFFDIISLFETSRYNHTPEHLVTIAENLVFMENGFPNYLKTYLPRLKQIPCI